MPEPPEGDRTLPLTTRDLLDALERWYAPLMLTRRNQCMDLADESARLRMAYEAGKAGLVAELRVLYERGVREPADGA